MSTHRQPDHDTTRRRSEPRPDPHKGGPDTEHERGKPGRDRRHDVEREHDIPDENGEPPSVKRRGGNPEESEPPVENT
ncbi:MULTISPECIES: hypothetical protein [Cupriavidus]|jgi:hypothetical protein|uniref:Uncharacterized protein n=1 Tax=Cupriavidus oxalaticus TaxID=96344 RepID=A0A375GLK4_9BURK|nr:hypothetical protein [Cupriavidus oxalaticus]QEZ43261.1 hypothetical protein D2917_02775 [Cupriavidus oxalaticus]QRQ85353.1 hypothetical protein JTE91_04565 [Cupriavidus oxalaticus]QRQ90559.1 hypothetical protein JTE92_07780 [Cupriavidus oxalaticus]WQD85080.1 hypothetical protein U0036_25905 [Cupriavidus oxalaticus]SPC24139.1 conserved hypothetical protein [Cupriavidus oxalaticus]